LCYIKIMVRPGLPLTARIWAPLLPYIVIGIGLLVLHNAWITILSYHLGMILILMFSEGRVSLRTIYENGNYKILVGSAVLGGTGGLLLYLLWPLLGIPVDIDLYLQKIGLTTAVWPYFIAYYILINPWLEEYYWRSYLGSNSKRITLNDLLFSGYHILVLAGKINVIWLITVFILLSLAGWFWRQVNRRNRGLAPSIISHIAADASVILTIYFMTGRI
jgi:hypothetical protein